MPKTDAALLVRETYLNADKREIFGETEQPLDYGYTVAQRGKLYRELASEYGRCASRIYIDRKDGSTWAVGWVFQKRMRYEDARSNRPEDHYTREVWVHLFEECEHGDPDELTKTHGRERCATGLKHHRIK